MRSLATDALEEKRIAELEAEAREAIAAAALLGEAERALGEQRNACVTATVGPLLDDALLAVDESSDDAVKRLTELTVCFAGQPLSCTIDEFELWMRDASSVLVLDPKVR